MKHRLASLALLAVAAGARAEKIYAVSTSRLLSFDSLDPNQKTDVGALSGVVAGQTIRAIDFRPADGTLYALSSSSSQAQLYTVSLATGALTAVGAGFALPSGTGTNLSMDFNPVADALRVVSGNGKNLRVSPLTGAILSTDAQLAYDPGDPSAGNLPFVTDVAYSNSVRGATSTTLYGYDYVFDSLVTVGTAGGAQSPNTGLLHTVGDSGSYFAGGNAMGFDISGATGKGYLSVDEYFSPGSAAEFFSVNLANGNLTRVGGNETLPGVIDISVYVAPVPEPASLLALGLGAASLIRRRARKAL